MRHYFPWRDPSHRGPQHLISLPPHSVSYADEKDPHTHTHTPTHCTLAYCTHTVHSPGNGYPFIQSLHQRTFLRPTDTHLAAFLFNFQFGFYFTARNFVGPSNSKFVCNLQRGNFKFESFKDSSPALKPLFFFLKKSTSRSTEANRRHVISGWSVHGARRSVGNQKKVNRTQMFKQQERS